MNRKSAQRIEQLTQQIKGNEAQTTSLPAGTTLRRRKIGTRRHTRSLHGPLPPGGLQNSAGVAAFWLGRPFAQTTASCVRFVKHDLPHMNFDGTFPHPQPARNGLVRVASTQEFEDRALPRC